MEKNMATCELQEQPSCSKPTPIYPAIVIERAGNQDTGELILPYQRIERWQPSDTVLSFINALNGDSAVKEELRRYLTFKLNHNTPSKHAPAQTERPVSAYFFYDQEHNQVIVEWGRVDPRSGEGKLHSMLNRTDRVRQLIARGMKLSSGHMAQVKGHPEYLAYFDSMGPTRVIGKEDLMGKTVDTLYSNGFIVLTAEGRVCFPAF